MDLSFLRFINPKTWFPSLPMDRQTTGVSLGESPAMAHTMTVDKVHSALRKAEAGDCEELFALYKEIRLGHAHLQTVMNQRKLAVMTKALTIVPEDPQSPQDEAAAKACQVLVRTPGWSRTAMNHLLNGHLYPLAVLEQVYQPAPAGSGLRYVPKGWHVVPYRLLDWTDGYLQIWDADAKLGHRLATKQKPDPLRHIIHRGHLLEDIPDNWGGPLRAALFWWLFATQDRDWWVRFLDRFGAPFLVARYDTNDAKSKGMLTQAFSLATRLFGLVVSKQTDIQVHAVATSSHGEAFKAFQEYAAAELSKLILGQSMTVTAQAGGLGGAQAEVQENTRGDIEAWDLTVLAETVRDQIIAPFLRINGIAGRAVLQVATDSAADLESKTKFLESATKAGLEPTDEAIAALSKAGGIQLQRAARPAPVPTFSAFAAEATFDPSANAALLESLGRPTVEQLDKIASRAAPSLARAFTGRYKPVADLIAASTSAEDLEHRLHVFFADLPAGRAVPIIQEALTAYAANGAATGPRKV
ncbi:MAG TPA: DUF935 family protein [Prosthecobacter sp.]